MALIRYEPWQGLNRLHDELDRMFRGYMTPANSDAGNETTSSTSDWTPAVDVKEEENRFLIHADIPGVDPKDIEVHMDNGVLTIKGERNSETKDEKNGYKRVERMYGSFYRRFTLPDTADAEQIKAECRNGVLEIAIPKKAIAQPRRIEVSH